jgi:hypothetical protein
VPSAPGAAPAGPARQCLARSAGCRISALVRTALFSARPFPSRQPLTLKRKPRLLSPQTVRWRPAPDRHRVAIVLYQTQLGRSTADAAGTSPEPAVPAGGGADGSDTSSGSGQGEDREAGGGHGDNGGGVEGGAALGEAEGSGSGGNGSAAAAEGVGSRGGNSTTSEDGGIGDGRWKEAGEGVAADEENAGPEVRQQAEADKGEGAVAAHELAERGSGDGATASAVVAGGVRTRRAAAAAGCASK